MDGSKGGIQAGNLGGNTVDFAYDTDFSFSIGLVLLERVHSFHETTQAAEYLSQ